MVHNVIKASIGRMEFYQSGKFACEENERTLKHLKDALKNQISRTQDREKRKVEGLHQQ